MSNNQEPVSEDASSTQVQVPNIEAKSNEVHLDMIRKAFDNKRRQALFTCSGTVPILSLRTPASATRPRSGSAMSLSSGCSSVSTSSHPTKHEYDGPDLSQSLDVPKGPHCSPVQLRWDSEDESVPALKTKLSFPHSTTMPSDNISQLIQDMLPPKYSCPRKSGNHADEMHFLTMSPARFTSTFHPHNAGIIDAATQLLLPSAENYNSFRSVRAELKDLQVYKPAIGAYVSHPVKGKRHGEDTDDSKEDKRETQTGRRRHPFATLLVCLPTPHQGGQLKVRHLGREIVYDWGKSIEQDNDVYWAAFYNECEYEVTEVTSGHLVMLRYDIHADPGTGFLTGECHVLNPFTLWPMQDIRALLKKSDFMPEGGHLGIFCRHQYHFTDAFISLMPNSLRGIDMVTFEVFKAFGLKIRMVAAIKASYFSEARKEDDDDDDDDDDHGSLGRPRTTNKEYILSDDLEYSEQDAEIDYYWHEDNVPWNIAEVRDGWRNTFLSDLDINWLSKPHHELPAMRWSHYYSNTLWINRIYSSCAMIITVPKPTERSTL